MEDYYLNMKKKRFFLILIILSLLIFIMGEVVLTAQSNVPEPRDIKGTVKAKRPIKYDKGKMGGTFVDALTGDPKTFNESQASDAYTTGIIAMTEPSAFGLNLDTGKWYVYLGDQKKGNSGPGYDIEVMKNGEMHVTVYLRRDIFWSDGKPVTADDFEFYWNKIVCEEDIQHALWGNTFSTLENGDEVQIKVKKVDKYTFTKIFPRTYGEPELQTNYQVMPKHILEPILKAKGPDGIKQMWGIRTKPKEILSYGPWIIDSFEAGTSIVLKRNDRFFDKDEWGNRYPYLDVYSNAICADQNTVVLKFRGGELDVLSSDHFPQHDFKTIVEEAPKKDYTVWNGGYESNCFFLTFNQNETSERMKGKPQLKWFKDKRFHYAISHLIDRETICQQAYNDLAEPSNSILTPASPYFDKTVVFDNSYNPKKSMKLFDEMGIRDRNGDSILEDKDGNNIKFELITYNDLVTTNAVVANLIKEWNANGVNATLAQVDFNTLTNITGETHNWEATIYAIGFGLFPIAVNVWPSNGNLHAWYPYQQKPATEWEAKIDKIHKAAEYEMDFKKRKALYNQMYQILYEELPLIPLVRRYKFAAVYNKWGNTAWDFYTTMGDDYCRKLYKK